MSTLCLVINPDATYDSEDSQIAYWEKRDLPDTYISIPEYLDNHLLQIRAEHMRWAYETGKTKYKNDKTFEQALEGDALPSMWWTSLIYERHPKLSPLLYDIYKLRCVELILAEKHISALTVIGGDTKLTRALKDLCESYKCAFRHIRAKTHIKFSISPRNIYNSLPPLIRGLLRYTHWWWKIRRKLPFIKKNSPGWNGEYQGSEPPATITTYFPNIDLQLAARGRFRSRYWENLHEALNQEARYEHPQGPHFVRWLFIRFPSPQLAFAECLKLRDLFQKEGKDGLSFNYLEEFLSTKDLFTAMLRWIRIYISARLIQKYFAKLCHFADSQLNFWAYQKGQWSESFCGWRCLERCLQNQAFSHYCQLSGTQRWHLFPLENCPWERMLTQHARLYKNQIYGAQHSIVRPTDFRYFDDSATFKDLSCAAFQPDIICGNGASACDQWLQNHLPADRLKQVEALRYQYLASEAPLQNGDVQDLPPEPGTPLMEPTPRRLLVLTSFFEDETFAHLDLLRKSLDNKLLSGWTIDIKPHPYLSVLDWLNSLPEVQREQIRILDAPLVMVLTANAHVWASNSTTAALEAAIKGLSLMVMRPVKDFDLCPIQNVPGLLRTGTLEEVKTGLQNMRPLRLPPDYLDLSLGLSAWRKLLHLHAQN